MLRGGIAAALPLPRHWGGGGCLAGGGTHRSWASLPVGPWGPWVPILPRYSQSQQKDAEAGTVPGKHCLQNKGAKVRLLNLGPSPLVPPYRPPHIIRRGPAASHPLPGARAGRSCLILPPPALLGV